MFKHTPTMKKWFSNLVFSWCGGGLSGQRWYFWSFIPDSWCQCKVRTNHMSKVNG